MMSQILVLVAVTCSVLGVASCDLYTEQAKRILQEVPLIDGHNDLSWNLILNTDGVLDLVDLERNTCDQYWNPRSSCHTDIPRLRQGMVGAQFWAIFTNCKVQYKNAAARTMQLIDLVKRMVNKYDYFFEFVTDADGIVSAHADGKLASLLGVEGGHMIGEDLSVLRMFYELGVRYMTLTWNCNTGWADNANPDGDSVTDAVGGLSEWGQLVVMEMNRLGMMVDLSHVSDETMLAVLDVSVAPVMFSHSAIYAVCPHRRNVPDDVLRRMPANGGLVMINFYNKFLNCTIDNRYERGYRSSDLDQLVEHIEHVVSVSGIDHVGLGSDFDGMPDSPDGLDDVSDFPNIVAHLLRRGWPEQNVKKLVGLNLLRVMRAAEQVRDNLASLTPDDTPYNATNIPDDTCKPPL